MASPPPPQKKTRTSSDKVASQAGVAASELDVQAQEIKLTSLPTGLLVANIFPFLKRLEWNNLSVVNTDIHASVESHDALIPPWPENCKLRAKMRTRGPHRDLKCPIWSPDGRNIACSGGSRIHIFDQCRGHVNTWKASDLSSRSMLDPDPPDGRLLTPGDICSLMYSLDGRLLVSSGYYRRVKIWDCWNDYECIRDWQVGNEYGTKVAFSPDSKLVAVLTCGMISLLRFEDGSVAKSCDLDMKECAIVLFCPDGHSVIFGGSDNDADETDGVIKVWRMNRSSDALTTMNVAGLCEGIVRDIAISADGSTIASTSDDGKIYLWKLADEGLECVQTFQGTIFSTAYSLSFTLDERYLVVGGAVGHLLHDDGEFDDEHNGYVRFWKLEDGSSSAYPNMEEVRALKCSPDESRFLVEDDEGVCLKSFTPVQNKDEGPSSARKDA